MLETGALVKGESISKIGTGNVHFDGGVDFVVVPEPSTWAILVLGAAALLVNRRRKRVAM